MSAGEAWDTLRHWHRSERVLEAASRPLGQVAVFLVACVLVLPSRGSWAPLACASLAFVQFAPELRRPILSLASLGVIYTLMAQGWDWRKIDTPVLSTPMAMVLGMVLVVAAICFAVYAVAVYYQRLPGWVRRHPILCLNLVVCAAVFVSPRFSPDDSGPVRMWSLGASALLFLVWRLGYLLLSARRTRVRLRDFPDHLFYLLPVFGGTNVPYGKGHDHLRRHEATDDRSRIASQLAGLKLLLLMWLWQIVELAIGLWVHADPDSPLRMIFGSQSLHVPRLTVLVEGELAPGAAIGLRWTSLLLELITRTLEMAIEGHLFIGLLRLYGFNVFRNTYKPLLSETLVDFWGRFHHYFKELLVEFFFLPTYLGWFKKQPKLRIFAATFAAAFAGNLYFHLLTVSQEMHHLTGGQIWSLIVPRAVYSFLLASGIFVSMLRQQAQRGRPAASAPSWPVRLRRIAGVWLFFALIHVYSLGPMDMSLAQRNGFLLSLFGLG